MSKVLIKGGRVVTAVDDYVSDILFLKGEENASTKRECDRPLA